MTVGIGITTLNRRDIALKSVSSLFRHTPCHFPIVIVDDGSDEPFPGAAYRNLTPKGVANAKNHCLRLLMANPEVKHIFLFDDDCCPVEDDWWWQYTDAGEHHLAYLHDNMDPAAHPVVYDDGKIIARARGTGCMLYLSRHAIETVGGFRKDFGRWGYEHDDLSHRLVNAGLIRFPYQGVSNQHGIWNIDEYEHGNSSVPDKVRSLLPENRKLFEKYRWDSDYVPYE